MLKIDLINKNKELIGKIFDLEAQLATTCDLLNKWAREMNVQECFNPYKELELRNLVDRLWCRVSDKIDHLNRVKNECRNN